MRKTLQARNIMSVLFGSINEFGCETLRNPMLVPGLPGSVDKSYRCTVSLTAKMADTATGRLLWGVNLGETAEGASLTAAELMKTIIRKANLGASLPDPTLEEPRSKWSDLMP